MTLTVQVELVPNKPTELVLQRMLEEYISLVNDVVDYSLGQGEAPNFSSSQVRADLPSALKNQALRDARSVYRKSRKSGIQSILKKPTAYWNNQNYSIGDDFIALPLFIDGKTKKTRIKALTRPNILDLLSSSKLGSLRVVKKRGKYYAQIAYEAVEAISSPGTGVMGVDLGIKCPAVAVTDSEKVRFFGNGRQNKYVRRYYSARRKKLGKAKKLDAIRKSKNKEQRWMRDRDHKVSRAIVDFAVENGVGTIKLEELSGIRATTRKSRKNNRSLHSWSFYRLASYIEYKAKLVGIDVVYVDPAYTSQTCPICGGRYHAKDRQFICHDCGYRSHRDIIGARNILAA